MAVLSFLYTATPCRLAGDYRRIILQQHVAANVALLNGDQRAAYEIIYDARVRTDSDADTPPGDGENGGLNDSDQ